MRARHFKRAMRVMLFVVAVTSSATSCSSDDPPVGPTSGSIELTVTTTGEDAPTGYAVTLDGSSTRSVDANGSVTFSSVSTGSHSVELTDVPANCTMTGANPVSVSVTAGTSAPAELTVECSALLGSIEVTVVSGGLGIPDGYAVAIDGGSPQTVSANGTVTFAGLPVGSHLITLSALPEDCSVSGGQTRTVDVTANELSTELFDIQCVTSRILYARFSFTELVTIAPDGTDLNVLIGEPDTSHDWVWSADGQIAFNGTYGGQHGMFRMKWDGSEVTYVSPPQGAQLAWSTDGTRIASSADGNIFVTNSDGSGTEPVTSDPTAADQQPAWSPDGNRIAFIRYVDGIGAPAIFVANVDGSGLSRLTDNPEGDAWPAWSPSGDRIAFRRGYEIGGESYTAIYTMNPDGSDVTDISGGPGDDGEPRWSPDGTRIAFRSWRVGGPGIFVVDRDGSNLTRLTTETTRVYPPSWSPDGTSVVYYVSEGFGDVYTVHTDGSNKTFVVSGVNPTWSPLIP